MKKLFALSVLTVAGFAAQAEVRINGFANMIAGITGSDETFFGYDDKVSFSPESLFAIQVSGDINSKMTATGQLVARGENDYDPDFEWAYMTYKSSNNLSISAGRLRLPLFSYSASKDVGYSYHWIATPSSVYDVPFNNLDGVRLDYSAYAGDWEYNTSLSVGAFSGKGFGSEISGKNVVFLSTEASYEWFKARAVIGTGNTTIDLSSSTSSGVAQLSEGFDLMANVGFAGLADSLKIDDDSGTFMGLSAQIDKFDWFVSGELTSIEVKDSFIAKTVAYYVTAGFRSGAWTPSVTYEKSKTDDGLKFQSEINQLSAAALPDALKQGLLAVAVGSQAYTQSENSVLSATVRYDFDTNVAFKADISKYSDDLNADNNATLVRFGVNYVF